MDIKIIIYVCSIIGEALVIGIPAIIKIIKNAKALKDSKTNEERMLALEDMMRQSKIFIQAAEIAYEKINETLKAKGSSAGTVKKDSVMLKLQSYASEKGYEFDYDFWSNKIDEEVAYTKKINVK